MSAKRGGGREGEKGKKGEAKRKQKNKKQVGIPRKVEHESLATCKKRMWGGFFFEIF